MKTTYALIDCNNFFVSCERLFRPNLEGKPVVVLSSNDGCAVSRSQEAKDLGIPMGAPHYKFREFFRQHGVVAFSANFELYGDISERITNLLATITPRIEVYSVDESFLDLSELDIREYQRWGHMVRSSVLRHVGVPVSIGVAGSKTLTKVANHWAKKHPETGGVVTFEGQKATPTPQSRVILSDSARETWPQGQGSVSGGSFTDVQDDELLATVLAGSPVQDIWGVGWKLTPKLKAEGVHTALDLARMSPHRAQQLMGIHGRQMQAELNGTACLPFMRDPKPQQMIMRGRQFGEDTRAFHVIESAVASLAARAAASLRREPQRARVAVGR
jgi:DNA polymerase V